MSQCYVCLEPCEYKSPCECEMVVHKKCLAATCRKIPTTDCTVCKAPIRVECMEFAIDPPSVLVYSNPVYKNNCFGCLCLTVFVFLVYLFFGWIGKLFLFILGYKTNLLCFWCLDHAIAAFAVLMTVTVVSHVCKK